MTHENSDKLCNRWIVEYDCWRMWTQFSNLGSVDGIPNRAGRWQDGPDPENLGDSKTDGCRLLMFFMCKISEAANEVSNAATQHDTTTHQTNLETAIDILDRISRHFTGAVESDDLKSAKLCLRVHAVLMPLRKNDRVTAKVNIRILLFIYLDFQFRLAVQHFSSILFQHLTTNECNVCKYGNICCSSCAN